jgi:hypothetical protein
LKLEIDVERERESVVQSEREERLLSYRLKLRDLT